ncbi:MAG: hypothetical protein VCB07_11030 [Gammaproteobacteria bacterium]
MAITARSFVASGWMLNLPSSKEIGPPSLVICPQQTPALRTWLTTLTPSHHYHGDIDEGSVGTTLSVLDPSCSIWAGSGIASVTGAEAISPPSASAVVLGSASVSVGQHLLNRYRARAPPSLG